MGKLILNSLVFLFIASSTQPVLGASNSLFDVTVPFEANTSRVRKVSSRHKRIAFSKQDFSKVSRFDVFYVLNNKFDSVIAEAVVIKIKEKIILAQITRLAKKVTVDSLRDKDVLESKWGPEAILNSQFNVDKKADKKDSTKESDKNKQEFLFRVNLPKETKKEKIIRVTEKHKQIKFSNINFPKTSPFSIFYVLNDKQNAVIAKIVTIGEKKDKIFCKLAKIANSVKIFSLKDKYVFKSEHISKAIINSQYNKKNPGLDVGILQQQFQVNSANVIGGADLNAKAFSRGVHANVFLPYSKLLNWTNWIGISGSYEQYDNLFINIKRAESNIAQETKLSGDKSSLMFIVQPWYNKFIHKFNLYFGYNIENDVLDFKESASGASSNSYSSQAKYLNLGVLIGFNPTPYLYLGGQINYAPDHKVSVTDQITSKTLDYTKNLIRLSPWVYTLIPVTTNKLYIKIALKMGYIIENNFNAIDLGSGNDHSFNELGPITFKAGISYSP